MDINTRVILNNPVWDANTVLNSIYLTVTGTPATAVQQVEAQGKYCIISNAGAVTLYVGNDADGTQVPAFDPTDSATFVAVGGYGIALEPNATVEVATGPDAAIYIRNVSATTAGRVSVLWFK